MVHRRARLVISGRGVSEEIRGIQFRSVPQLIEVAVKPVRARLRYIVHLRGLISPLEHRDLSRLVEDRNRCAHPSISSADELYQPSAELARYHLRNAVEYLLQHPPVQGKAALSKVMADIDGALFPTRRRMPPSSIFTLVLWLTLSCTCPQSGRRVAKTVSSGAVGFKCYSRCVLALNALRTMHPEPTEQALKEKLNEVTRAILDSDLLRLVVFLGKVDDCWHFLADDVVG